MQSCKFIIDVIVSKKLSTTTHKSIKKNLTEFYKTVDHVIPNKVKMSDDLISFEFLHLYNKSIAELHQMRIDYSFFVQDMVKGFCFLSRTWHGYECYGIPEQKIESQDVIISLLPNEKIRDIYKYINCYKLTIKNLENLSGGLLGLMYLKDLNSLIFEQAKDDRQYKAMQIVIGNIMEDKDILDCQEELITNGFKEYAKL